MDYDAIANHFLVPAPTSAALIEPRASDARRLRDSLEAIATIGWWSRPAAEGFLGLGHDFFDGYVWGRAAALGGDVASPVVVSAFGVFSSALLTPVYEHGRTISSRDDILSARSVGAAAGLRAATASVATDVVDRVGTRLLAAVQSVEPGPRHLFGALQALSVPDDPHGRLWRAAELVREHRGDSHLAACAVAGLDMAEMNVLTEVWLGYPVGEYSATRGFSQEQLRGAADRLQARGWFDASDALTARGRAERESIEAATDLAQHQLIGALATDLETVITDATLVSQAVISSQAAPADPRKRAAG